MLHVHRSAVPTKILSTCQNFANHVFKKVFQSPFLQESGSTQIWRSCMRLLQGDFLTCLKLLCSALWRAHSGLTLQSDILTISPLMCSVLKVCVGNLAIAVVVAMSQNCWPLAILKYHNIACLAKSQYCRRLAICSLSCLLVVLSLHCKSHHDLHLAQLILPSPLSMDIQGYI